MYDIEQILEDEDAIEENLAINEQVFSFEINKQYLEEVKHTCIKLDIPLVEEYDFKNDSMSPNLNIDLKPSTSLRPYQETSLAKVFGNGRGELS